MIQESIKSLFLEVNKRLINPFFGAFILSWMAFNWEIVYTILFIDEMYLSIPPEIISSNEGVTKIIFNTKIEYIKQISTFNIIYLLTLPLISSILLLTAISAFTTWLTTYMDVIIKNIKNKVLKKESLTVDQSDKLKNQLVELEKNHRDSISEKNEEITLLNSKIRDQEKSIEDKVNSKLNSQIKKYETKESEFIEQFKQSEEISLQRFEENKKLREQINVLEKRNTQIKKSEIDNKKIYIKEYQEFKESTFFQFFSDIIDQIEKNSSNLKSHFDGKILRYLKTKKILKMESIQIDQYHYEDNYSFTDKGNAFCEYFLDNYKIEKAKEISPEDLPF